MAANNTFDLNKPAEGFSNGFHNGIVEHVTITSTFSYLVREAENYFGERDKSFTLVGIEYKAAGQPQILYSVHDRFHVIVALSNIARTNLNAALVELAHEVVHCLDPSRGGATVLEEACCAWFAREMSHRFGWQDSSDANYEAARMMLEPIMKNAPSSIREMRRSGINFGSIDIELLRKQIPLLSEDDSKSLAQNFEAFCASRASGKT